MTPTVTHFPDRAEVVTPDDSVTFNPSTILVIDGGDIVVKARNSDTAVTLTACPAYYIIPFRVSQVLATGTVAADIVKIS